MKLLTFLKKDWPALLFLVIPSLLTLLFWSQLPEQIATHWNVKGEVNGYQSKMTFLLFSLGVNVLVYTLLAIVPYIDPKPGARRLVKPMRALRIVTMAFTTLVLGGIVLRAVGYAINMLLIGKIAPILLYLVIGNLMGKFPPNYFAGIRTPWTLEHPEVWRQVHRFAAKLWVAGSLILLIFVFRWESEAYAILFLTTTFILVLVPVIYSYLLYRKLRREKTTDA